MVVPRRLLLLAATLLALLAAAPAAEAKRRVPQGFFGTVWDGSVVHADDDVQNAQWARMSRTGVESVRAVFSWASAQEQSGASVHYERTDRLVELAVRHGMRLLPVVADTPSWARAYNNRFSPPRRFSDFGVYLRTLAERYGSDGTFWTEHPELPKHPIRVYQIWNEPDLPYRWYAKKGSPYAWPGGYVRLLEESRRVLDATDPSAKLVLAGLTNDSWNHLRVLYKRHVRSLFDIAAIQTYTSSPRDALKAIRLFRRVMRRYKDRRKPIWATETSWPAARGRMRVPRGQRSLVTTDRGMAFRLGKVFAGLAKKRRLRRYGVGRVFWYTWSSPYRKVSDIFDFAGLQSFYKGRFRRKPALRAFRRAARRYEGCAKNSLGVCK